MADMHPSLRLADLAMGLTHAPHVAPTHATEVAASASPTSPVVAPPIERAPAARPLREVPVVPAAPAPAAAPLDRAGRQAALDALRERHDQTCAHCTTATAHTRTVFGEGDPEARLLFVGEAPGETEDQLGRPFVGRAGEKLDEMIVAMGLRRDQVYIANVLKSRPPDNRTPLQHEVDACGPFLIEQIRILRPKVIVALGGPATKLLLGTEVGITRLRGAWQVWKVPEGNLEIPLMPTYHPAYLLRNYTPKTRGEVWSDLQAVMAALGLSRG